MRNRRGSRPQFQRVTASSRSGRGPLAGRTYERGLLAAHQVGPGGERRVQLAWSGLQLGRRRAWAGRSAARNSILGGVDLGPGDGGSVALLDGVVVAAWSKSARAASECAEPGLLGGGAQGVPVFRPRRRGGELGGHRPVIGLDTRLGGRTARSGGEAPSSCVRRRPVRRRLELGRGVGGRRRPAAACGSASWLEPPVEFGDSAGVRLVRLQRGALAGQRGPAYGGEGRRGRGRRAAGM